VREYRQYTDAVSVPELLLGRLPGTLLELVAFALLMRLCWSARNEPRGSEAFASMTAVVLAFTVLLLPTDSVYNQVFLAPSVLLLARDRRVFWNQGIALRVLFVVAALLVVWPWVSSTVLVGLSFLLRPSTVERAWAVPIWTSLTAPVGVAAAVLVYAWRQTFAASGHGRTS